MSVFSFLVLLPLNFTGGGGAKTNDLKGYVDSLLFTDFLRFTMANIKTGSDRLWVHCAGAYLLTIIVVRELLIEYNAYSSIRHRYLLSKEPHLRTILVSNIPRHLRSPRKIGNYFRHVYPDAVKSVTICQNLLNLETMVTERTGVLAQIERELLILCRYEKRNLMSQDRLSHKISSAFWTCHLCEKIGVIDEAQERISKLYVRLEEMNKNIEKEQTRRRQVMQYMDRMVAGEGREDIDYTLASSFDCGGPAWKKALRQRKIQHRRQLQQQQHQDQPDFSYRPPAIGSPRNGDGVPRRKEEASAENPEAEVPPLHGGDANDDRYEAFPTIVRDLPGTNTKKSRNPVRFAKAKTAIKRYTTYIPDPTVFGRSLTDLSTSEEGKFDSIEDHTNEVTDEVTDAMNNAREMLMRTFRTSLHANRNTASNGSSHKPCSSHQPLYTPLPPITHHTTNPTHPSSISRSTPTSTPQNSL